MGCVASQLIRPVVVYDGGCTFCQAQIARIQRYDPWKQFEYVARQTPGLEARFPPLAEADFEQGMRLIGLDGRIHVGADAVYQIARRLAVWRWVAWVYRLPVARGVARLIYRWIAANRHVLGRSCDSDSCAALEPPLEAPSGANHHSVTSRCR
jgi:predicted DCC family thiol-disulfide oxidoreductase YuxK